MNFAALLPSLLVRSLLLAVQLLLFVVLITVSQLLDASPRLTAALYVTGGAAIVLAGELLHRTLNFRVSIVRVALQSWHALISRLRSMVKGTRGMSLALFLLTVAYLTILVPLLVEGIESPVDLVPTHGNDLMVGVLTLATAVLALSFAGSALVVELIVGSYSHRFARVFLEHWTIVLTFLMNALIAAGNFILLWYGWNRSLATASMLSGLYVVVSLSILVWRVSYFLNVSTVAQEVGDALRRYVIRSLRGLHALPVGEESSSSFFRDTREMLSLSYEVHVLGKMPSAYASDYLKLDVPDQFADELSERTRPLFSACTRAIQQDRRGIALSIMNELLETARAYYEARRKLPSTQDKYTLFMIGQFDIMYQTSLAQPNEQFTGDIVAVVGKMSEAALSLTPFQIRKFENPIAALWASSLTRMAILAYPLDHSIATTAACTAIADLGVGLIGDGAITTALYGPAEKIKEVGKFALTQSGLRSAHVTQPIIHGHVKMIEALFNASAAHGYYYESGVTNLVEGVRDLITDAYKSPRDVTSNMAIIAPLVGSLWRDVSIIKVYRHGLRLSGRIDRNLAPYLVRDLEHLIRLIRDLGVGAIRTDRFSDYEFCQSLSEMAWETISHIRLDRDNPLDDQWGELPSAILEASIRIMATAIEIGSDNTRQILFNVSPVFAFLAYFSRDDETSIMYREFERALVKLVEKVGQAKVEDDDLPSHAVRNMGRYLKMFAAWHARYHPQRESNALLRRALLELGVHEWDAPYMASGMENLGYPSEFGSESWYVYPARSWVDYQWKVTNELNNLSLYEEFNRSLTDGELTDDE